MDKNKNYVISVAIAVVIIIAAFGISRFVFLREPAASISIDQLQPIKVQASSFAAIDKNNKLLRNNRLVIIENFHAIMLNNDRNLHIYLPPSYYKNIDKKYPVLYVQDGKSIFELSDWSKESLEMHITADKLISEGKIEEIIIVGIDNIGQDRASEYAHWNGIDMGKPITAKGLQYEDFVINDVKPFVDKNFRTLPNRENTALVGASLGGLATFNIGFRHAEVFSKLAMLSPYLGWGDGRLYKMIEEGSYKEKKPLKMWVDVGSKESEFVDMAAYGILLLYNNSYKYLDELVAYEAPGGEHSERFWAERVEPVLIYFYGEIGSPKSIELFMNKKLSMVDSQLRHINAVLTYDSGFRMTDVLGKFEVEKPEVLNIQPMGGAMTPLSQGLTKIRFISSTGLTAEDEITVVRE